jgi:purine nucleosidase
MKKIGVLLIGMILMMSVSAQKQKVIFDCDIAGDIDDAYALALMLCSPEFEILGITVDHGLTHDRAKVACRMLYETGLEHIPVYLGRETAGVVGKKVVEATYSQQFYWAKNFDKLEPQEKPAADFIIETLRKDPEVLQLTKAIYSMFGSFYAGYGDSPVIDAEWNVRADIASSQKFASCGANIIYAGLDVTNVKFPDDLSQKLLMRQSPLTNALCGLETLWGRQFNKETDPTLFDCVAVGMFLWPDLFTTRRAHVEVDDKGYTIVDNGKAPNCQIGMEINKQEFLNRLMERYLTQNFCR